MEYFWTINVTQSEHDWIAKHMPAVIPKIEPTNHRTMKHWQKRLNAFEHIEVMVLMNDKQETWIDVLFYVNDNLAISLITTDLDETVEFDFDGDTYYVNIKTPEDSSVDVLQRPVDVAYHCPTCEYDGTIDYDAFCDDHGEPQDWNTFECENCGQAIHIESQEWC
ncbi:MAG: hypothetical protein HDQ88_08915 [Clostridia bacterium]|nr:hypothetical protein [Clostridia bacterium]